MNVDHLDPSLPQEIYNLYLKDINGIFFSRREIDIISCILSGHTAKKIASFLLLSPRTIENHIRNIMLKLNCNTQGSIIDFIEKSNKFIYIKKYYFSLLTKNTFELELKKLSLLITKTAPVFCVFVSEEEKSAFNVQLEKHLNLAGIKTTLVNVAKFKSFSSLAQPISCVIYDFSPSAIEQPEIENYPIVINLSQMINRNEDPQNAENYYFFIFKLLKKLLPKINIEESFLKFKKHHETLLGSTSFHPKINDNKHLPTNNKFKPAFIFKNKWALMSSICFVLLLSFIFLKTSTEMNFVNMNRSKTWNLPRQDHLFVGRENLLKILNQKLNSLVRSTDEPQPLMVSVCTGLGGVGKTQLALQYIHHSKHPYTLKAWFSAENTLELQRQYLELAQRVGYMPENPIMDKAIEYLKTWLETHPNWLLVYDDVGKYEDIKSFLPRHGGNILITSRSQEWPDRIEVLPITVMEESEALELLKNLIKRDDKEVKELARNLGYLPLALAQAGAYIYNNGKTIHEYLELYHQYEQKMLADKTMPLGTDHVPVAITWNTSLDAIDSESKKIGIPPLAPILITACAYLDSEEIPRTLLLNWFKKAYPQLEAHEFVLDRLLGQLKQYSLINVHVATKNISLHRLIQTVLRYKHQEACVQKSNYPGLTTDWYNMLFKAALDEFFGKNHSHTTQDSYLQKKLLRHLQSLIKHYDLQWQNEPPNILVAKCFFAIGNIFLDEKSPETAKMYYEKTLKIQERFYGKFHPEVAITLANLGAAYRDLGEARLGKELLEQALRIQEKSHGKEHPEVALTLTNLGAVYRDLGEFTLAKSSLEKALKTKKEYYGENSIETAITLTMLGSAYRLTGESLPAVTLLEKALQIKEQFYEKDHPQIAITLTHLGAAYRDLGFAKKAKETLEKALEIHERYYKEEHPILAGTLTDLGEVHEDLGETKQAKARLERALKIREQYYNYGKIYPKIASTLTSLGRTYRDLGDTKQAKEALERALKINEQHYGKEHVQIACPLTNLSRVLRDLGEAKQAKELLEKALTLKEQHYGKNHPSVASTLSLLGRTYRDLGEIKQAKEALEQALEIQSRSFGEDHLKIASTLTGLGRIYRDLGEIQQAKIILEKALKIKEQHYQGEHPKTAITLTELGRVYGELGEHKQAKALLEKALKIKEQHYGKEHSQMITTLFNLGIVCTHTKEIGLAKELLERALKIQESYYGKNHPEIALTLQALENIHKK